MLKNIKRKDSGFTLVELLIVIVIIAILAVLTLVGVNGYINRANDSKAKDSAGQLRTKVEAWAAINTTYPDNWSSDNDTWPNGQDDTDDVTEAELNDSLRGMMAASTSDLSAKTPLVYTVCSDNAGATIEYWSTKTKTTPTSDTTIKMGDTTNCS